MSSKSISHGWEVPVPSMQKMQHFSAQLLMIAIFVSVCNNLIDNIHDNLLWTELEKELSVEMKPVSHPKGNATTQKLGKYGKISSE